MSFYDVDPISRIEGHLGVKVTTGAAGITEADAHGNLWRGFENFLIGRPTNDAITFTQRICGVCPLPHATASTFATEHALGVSDGYITFEGNAPLTKGVPRKAVLIRNLVYASEWVMSSITHFYHLAAPSYIQGPNMAPWTPYYSNDDYNSLLRNGAVGSAAAGSGAVTGRALPQVQPSGVATGMLPQNLWSFVIKSYIKALRMRRLTFEAGALFAGRMPMTSSFVAGGVTQFCSNGAVASGSATGVNAVPLNFTSEGAEVNFQAKCQAFYDIMKEVGQFCFQEYIPLACTLGLLYTAWDNPGNGGSGYGAGVKNFLAWGAFPATGSGTGTAVAVPGGWYINSGSVSGASSNYTGSLVSKRADVASALIKVQDRLREFIPRSNYQDQTTPEFDGRGKAYPGAVTRTVPNRAAGNNYSWLKAPRWGEWFTVATGSMSATGFSATGGAGSIITVSGAQCGWDDVRVSLASATGVAFTNGTDFTVPTGTAAVSGTTFTVTRTAGGGIPLNTEVNVRYKVYYPMEVGPLARMVVAGTYKVDGTAVPGVTGLYFSGPGTLDATRLSNDIVAGLSTEGLVGGVQTWLNNLVGGFSIMDRLRARALETHYLMTWMLGTVNTANGVYGSATLSANTGWIGQLSQCGASGATYTQVLVPSGVKTGVGVSEAPRGALAHFCTSSAGRITQYQCVVPTTWNGSPKNGTGSADRVAGDNLGAIKRGPIEQSCIGVPFTNNTAPNSRVNGVEVMRCAQSFDPCIACAVH